MSNAPEWLRFKPPERPLKIDYESKQGFQDIAEGRYRVVHKHEWELSSTTPFNSAIANCECGAVWLLGSVYMPTDEEISLEEVKTGYYARNRSKSTK